MPRKGMRTIFSSSSPSSQPTPNYSFLSPIMNQHIEKAEPAIKKWDLEEGSTSYCRIDTLFSGDRSEANFFLKSVKNLRSAIQFISSEDPNSDKLIRAHNLMEIAMKSLQKEFHRMLSTNRPFLDCESVSNSSSSLATARTSTSGYDNESEDDDTQAALDSISEMERSSEIAIMDLKSIVDAMISSGYGKQCETIYKTVRKSIVDESLHRLGVEKLNLLQIQKMDWEEIEIKIKLWLNALKPAITSLFQGEKILCEQVFSAYTTIQKSCFADIVGSGAKMIFEFTKNVAKYKALALEKIFRVLDLYEALSELIPEIESVFSDKSLNYIKSQAINSLVKLDEATRYMLADFEAAIQKDISKLPKPGGGIHPLTRYVMNYLIVLSDYSGTLTDILADSPSSVHSPMPESYFSSPISNNDPSSVLSAKFAWIILLLLCKLDIKAELYGDVALSYLFLANNLNYVVLKVRDSNLKILLGDEWLVSHEKKVRQYSGNYERIGWIKVVSSLINPTTETPPEALRECIRNFAKAFEETYRKQSSWVVPEQKLRDEIRVSIAKKIGTPYRVVCQAYRSKMKGRLGVECLVRYAPDNFGNYLSDLFYGTVRTGSL